MQEIEGKRVGSAMVWGLTLAGVGLIAASLVFAAVGLPVPVYPGLIGVSFIATPLLLLGGLICARKPQVRLGRLLLGLGLVGSVQLASGEYATYSVLGRSGRLFVTGAAGWLSSVAQVFTVVGLVAIILLFPTGRLLSRRWRPVAWAVGAGLVGAVAVSFGGPTFNSNLDFVRNPLYVAHPAPILVGLEFIGWPVLMLGIIGSIAQLVVRLRRSRGEEREQLKWFAYAGITAPLIIFTVSGPLGNVAPLLGNVVWTLGPLSLLAAVGIAVLRYRLYDIDVIINKTIVYFCLAAVITAIYVGIVVGVGALINARGNVGLSILATAVVAVGFQPIRERSRRFANRLVYGKRATPYEVLSEFAERMASTHLLEDVLPRTARLIAEGTGAVRADVWLGVGSELRAEGSWPAADDRRLPLTDGDHIEVPGATTVVPVRHQGDLLGALSLQKPPNDPLTPAEEKLLSDVASQAGLVLRNVRLIEYLRASRQRLVQAQDEERRRLERNIHDGAQQQLVALAIKANLAESFVGRDEAKERAMLVELKTEATEALENLRELARGIYPPLLADKGLAAALEAQARRSPVPVAVESDGVGRYPQDVEAAVYFCCLEALQNVAKYAAATSVTVRLRSTGDGLAFEVSDDGAGFDSFKAAYGTGLQGMSDRLAALGGELHVDSAPGKGTTITGRLPLAASNEGAILGLKGSNPSDLMK